MKIIKYQMHQKQHKMKWLIYKIFKIITKLCNQVRNYSEKILRDS